MQTEDICAVVVLYNSDECVYDNILTYANDVDILYIVDNSDDVYFDMELLSSKVKGCIKLLSRGTNVGVATALDMALRQADNDGYTWLLTMDQDGSFEKSMFEKILHCANSGDNDNILLKAPLHNATAMKINKNGICHREKVDIVMTSGNLVHVQNAVKIGGYNRKLFIDEVDHEFCLRGQLSGYDILVFPSLYVNHVLGDFLEIGGKKYRIYPPERLYYMARNYLYFRKNYNEFKPYWFKRRTKFLKLFFVQHLLYSPQRMGCFYMLLRGWYDYKNNNFGPLK